MSTQQNFVGRYQAGTVITISGGKYNPKNDGSDAIIPFSNLVDQTGTAFGTAGNPIFTSGSGGAGGAPYAATPLGYQQITAGGVQTLTIPATSTFALISIEAVDVRWRDDGVNPSASVGMLMFAGVTQTFSGASELAALKFIQTAAGSIINVSYYK